MPPVGEGGNRLVLVIRTVKVLTLPSAMPEKAELGMVTIETKSESVSVERGNVTCRLPCCGFGCCVRCVVIPANVVVFVSVRK